ncbi:MAG: biotin synthase BioB [Acidobacteriota bacterium]|nr:biotin synthase BioB [Acidobacteriota bacterium]
MTEKSAKGLPPTREEALGVLALPDGRLDELLEGAFALRQAHKGMKVGVQLLSSARSGGCTQDCAYCAQAKDSTADIETYRAADYRRLDATRARIDALKLARHCIGLSGLRFTDEEIEEFAAKVARLRASSPTPICCSIGFLTEAQARRLKEAGVGRINHNLNTGRRHYPKICTTHGYDERLANLAMLRRVGFELCCGGIVGMGEGDEDVADLFEDIAAVAPEAVPVNFLIPLAGTKLAEAETARLTPAYCLKVLCLARFTAPRADVRCAAGREVYLAGHEREMFMAVDSVFASGYLTAGGQGVEDTLRLIREAGFEPE